MTPLTAKLMVGIDMLATELEECTALKKLCLHFMCIEDLQGLDSSGLKYLENIRKMVEKNSGEFKWGFRQLVGITRYPHGVDEALGSYNYVEVNVSGRKQS
jgi:hypothetical protein